MSTCQEINDELMLAVAARKLWPPIKKIVASGHRKVVVDHFHSASPFFRKLYQADAAAAAMHKMMEA